MKDGGGQLPSSSSTRAAAAAAAAAAAVSTAVGPLRVVGSTSKNKLSTRVPPKLISSRGPHGHNDDDDDDDDDRRTGGEIDVDDQRGDDDLGDEGDDDDSDAEHGQGGGESHAGSGETGPGVVMSDDEGGGREGHGDADAPGLGSFSTMGAVIGDFSPQFKFSFTDDIHLDLGGGLKVGGRGRGRGNSG